MKLQQATEIAAEIIQTLKPDCVQIETAGSISRLKPDVKDVEIVYISNTSSIQMDLFGSHHQTRFHTDDAIDSLIINGVLAKDTVVMRWGPKYKRAIHLASGIVVELFRAVSDNWGYILALRTGPDDFNKVMVTKKAHGGALPPDIQLKDGHVWHIGHTITPTRIPTPTEAGFFALLDLPFIPPQDRTAERLRRCIEKRKNQGY